jgi:SHS2 domain-containing protein
MSFRLRDHTADVAVEATAETLGGVFAAVADGMAAAMCDAVPVGGDRHRVAVTAEGPEALLFDYLDELLYERDTRSVLPVDNDVTVTGGGETETGDGSEGTADTPEAGWRVSGSYRGVPLSAVEARDLKAVTYSEMDLSPTDAGWHAYVVFDV